jgi:transcriptional regulator with XRE-family HTH domain
MGAIPCIINATIGYDCISPTNYIAQIEQQNRFPSSEMLERIAAALKFDSPELFSTGPFPVEALIQLQEGVKADIEERIESLIKPNKKAVNSVKKQYGG